MEFHALTQAGRSYVLLESCDEQSTVYQSVHHLFPPPPPITPSHHSLPSPPPTTPSHHSLPPSTSLDELTAAFLLAPI